MSRKRPGRRKANGRSKVRSRLNGSAATCVLAPPQPAPAPPPPPERFETDVKRAAVNSALWTIIGFALLQVLRFGSNLVLTRLLAPEIFGVMALVNLFILGLHMFSDFGIQQSVIYSKHGDDADFLNSAWTLQAVRGLVLFVISCGLAWPVAHFYDEPALLWLLPVAGVGALFAGFNSTALFTLNRRLMRGRLVLMDLMTYALSTAIVIGWVYWLRQNKLSLGLSDTQVKDRQLAALVAGNLISWGAAMIVSYRLLPGHRHRFHWSWHQHPELLSFGGWIFVSTACTFLASQADRLVVGKISGTHLLGVYHIAAMLVNMPTLLVTTLGSYLVFPLYSRLLNSGRDIRETFGNVHQVVGGFSAMMVTAMLVGGPTAITCLYDERYQGAGEFLQLLAAAAWFTMLQTTSERVLEARGQTRFLAMGQMAKLAALPFLLLGGYHLHGVIGMVVGLAIAEFGRYALITWFVYRQGMPVFLCDLRLTLLLGGLSGAAYLIDHTWWSDMPKWGRFSLQATLVCGLWSLVLALWLYWGRLSLKAALGREPRQSAAVI